MTSGVCDSLNPFSEAGRLSVKMATMPSTDASCLLKSLYYLQAAFTGRYKILNNDYPLACLDFAFNKIRKAVIFFARPDIGKRQIQFLGHQGSLRNPPGGNTGNKIRDTGYRPDRLSKFFFNEFPDIRIG